MKRVRLLHTADLHLDASFASSGLNSECGGKLRQMQRDVLSRIVEHARNWPADALLIAGDLFEGDRVTPETIAFLAQEFEHLAPTPVYIAPGNRDPYTPSSAYASELWPENVHIFQPGVWSAFEHPGASLTVHGFGCDGSEPDPAWPGCLVVPEDGRTHVAVVHATESAHAPEATSRHACFKAADFSGSRLAYVALGHVHPSIEIKDATSTVMRYSGAPGARNMSEWKNRSLLEVELLDDGGEAVRVSVTPAQLSTRLFARHVIELTADMSASLVAREVFARLCREDVGEDGCLQIVFTGTIADSFHRIRREIETLLDGRFLHVRICDETARFGRDLPRFSGIALKGIADALRQRIEDAADVAASAIDRDGLDLLIDAARGGPLPDGRDWRGRS